MTLSILSDFEEIAESVRLIATVTRDLLDRARFRPVDLNEILKEKPVDGVHAQLTILNIF